MNNAISKRSRRLLCAGGWALVLVGVFISWMWSEGLATAGKSGQASLAGASTFVLFAGALTLFRRGNRRPGKRAHVIYTTAVAACAVAAVVAGVVPIAVTAATTGTVTTSISPDGISPQYRLSSAANITSDGYRQTSLDVTVHTSDRTTPLMTAVVSFADGTPNLTCANTRPVWTHSVSTVTLMCEKFTPISSLRTVSAISVVEK
jgi:hypothetical protein